MTVYDFLKISERAAADPFCTAAFIAVIIGPGKEECAWRPGS
jgi:hypothetical protein